jgi:MoxR-like ATPase
MSATTTDPQRGDGLFALDEVVTAVSGIVLGKETEIRLALACLLGHGHLLIEDMPGVGKTMLAHALARSLGLDCRRVQFTSDLLPADVLGASIYDRVSGQFHFHAGPVFTQVVLTDEINRAPPKTQSALLEAMEEEQVTLEGETRSLPRPFFVIATQNPREQAGTFALPESQLDRFLMRITLGYPDREAERALLAGTDRRDLLGQLEPVCSPARIIALQHRVARVHASAAILDYVQRLLAASRVGDRFVAGLSPRAGQALLRAARAWALLSDRDYVLPEDVQAVLGPVVDHRLQALERSPEAAPGRVLAAAVAVE